jgi:hypothetical protein
LWRASVARVPRCSGNLRPRHLRSEFFERIPRIQSFCGADEAQGWACPPAVSHRKSLSSAEMRSDLPHLRFVSLVRQKKMKNERVPP